MSTHYKAQVLQRCCVPHCHDENPAPSICQLYLAHSAFSLTLGKLKGFKKCLERTCSHILLGPCVSAMPGASKEQPRHMSMPWCHKILVAAPSAETSKQDSFLLQKSPVLTNLYNRNISTFSQSSEMYSNTHAKIQVEFKNKLEG